MANTDTANTTTNAQDQTDLTDQMATDNTVEKPITDPYQVAARPYLGKDFQPENILKSPDASLGEKSTAAEMMATQQAKEQQMRLAEKAKSYNAWQTATENYHRLSAMAEKNPGRITMPDAPDPGKFGLSITDIGQLSNPNVQKVAGQAVQSQNAEDQKSLYEKQQAEALGAGQKQAALQTNMMLGYMNQQNKISDEHQRLMDEAIKTVDDKQFQLDKIDPGKFWNNLSGGQKILGTVAIALGEVGKSLTGQNNNVALDMINKNIDRDIEAQKWTNDQKVQVKQNALKRIGLEIEKYSALSHDQDRKMQMNMMAQNIAQQADQLKMQTAQKMAIAKAASGEGLSQSDAEVLLDDAQKKRAVTLPNGRVVVSPIELTAEDRKLLLDKSTGMKLIKEYQDLVNNTSAADKLNPVSSAHERIATLRRSIGGLMHTDLVGPGPYTEQKQQKVDEILGNAFITTPGLFNSRMNALGGQLNSSIKNTYKSVGISLPQTAADNARRELLTYKNKDGSQKYSPEAIETAIRKKAETDPRFKE